MGYVVENDPGAQLKVIGEGGCGVIRSTMCSPRACKTSNLFL